MGRGKTHKPATCIWAALEAKALITAREASDYRVGERGEKGKGRKPAAVTLRAWAALGYVPGEKWPSRAEVANGS